MFGGTRMSRKNKLTKHHIVPTSKGGKNLEDNLSYVLSKQHEAYHILFINKTPDEIINYLVDSFWNGNKEWVGKYIDKYV